MASSTFSATYTSSQTISIPANATNISIQVAAARGGTGGNDSIAPGGIGGNGRFGTFTIQPSFVARNLQLNIGTIGGNGSNGSGGAGGGGGGGVAAGGNGGRAGFSGSSGGGGGGGGATGVYDSFANTWIIVAGGGGGGGGASFVPSPGFPGFPGNTGGDWGSSVGSITNGSNAPNKSGDGGAGGGGGGGVPGGGGGFVGQDGRTGGGPGGGGGSGYNTSYATLTSSNVNSGNGYVFIQYTVLTPQINNFSANPNPQTSGSDGIQNYNTTLSWNTSDVTSVSISNIGAVGSSGSTSVTNLPQSTVGSSSPATRSYTLTACAGSTCVNQTITVQVFNDNTPDNYIISNQSNLEPNTLTTTSTTTITGIDMQTTVSAGPGVQVSNNSVNWSGSVLVSNNNQVFARAVSPPFNTDPSGLTNSSQFYIDIGPVRRFFTLTTRAPDVSETFNFANEDDRVPYPDIDTITTPPDNPAEPYISSNTLNVDDIEIPVEVKTNNSNIQIRVKRAGASSWENWQDTRSI